MALGALSFAGGCSAPKQAWREPVPEVLVEVVPPRALLALDGRVVGAGGRAVPVPEAAHRYLLEARAAGFEPRRVEGTGEALAGSRVGLVLRPEGYGEARPLDLDDARSLAAAASFLGHQGRHREALLYAERAVEASPDEPLAHRAVGDAAIALGDRKRAAQAYSAYLVRAPRASDRRAVEERISELRGDLTIPGDGP